MILKHLTQSVNEKLPKGYEFQIRITDNKTMLYLTKDNKNILRQEYSSTINISLSDIISQMLRDLTECTGSAKKDLNK